MSINRARARRKRRKESKRRKEREYMQNIAMLEAWRDKTDPGWRIRKQIEAGFDYVNSPEFREAMTKKTQELLNVANAIPEFIKLSFNIDEDEK